MRPYITDDDDGDVVDYELEYGTIRLAGRIRRFPHSSIDH